MVQEHRRACSGICKEVSCLKSSVAGGSGCGMDGKELHICRACGKFQVHARGAVLGLPYVAPFPPSTPITHSHPPDEAPTPHRAEDDGGSQDRPAHRRSRQGQGSEEDGQLHSVELCLGILLIAKVRCLFKIRLPFPLRLSITYREIYFIILKPFICQPGTQPPPSMASPLSRTARFPPCELLPVWP